MSELVRLGHLILTGTPGDPDVPGPEDEDGYWAVVDEGQVDICHVAKPNAA